MQKRKRKKDDSFAALPFAKLGKLIDPDLLSRRPRAAAPMQRPMVSDEDDEALFAAAMNDVQEIEAFRRLPLRSKRVTPGPEQPDPDGKALNILQEIACGSRPLDLTHTQEYVEWTNRAVRQDLSLCLHQGRFSVQDAVDLHGFTVPEAEEVLDRFFKDAIKKGHRCVKIIHGRGLRSKAGPVVKRAVVKLLSSRYRKKIIAYVTARQSDGGLGALYVLLAKQYSIKNPRRRT